MPSDQFSGLKEMNSVKLEDFKGFERNWKLVTVRFRKDTDEMRWTFANDLAWKTLESGSIDYPDGAIFAKIGIKTNEDSQFPSSSVPQGARRYQFMIRGKEEYKDTGGWNYALFDVNGLTFPENPKTVAQACFACHKIVENRGQIFSQPFELAPFVKVAFLTNAKGFANITFNWVNVSTLPNTVKFLLPKKTKRVRAVSNDVLIKNIFQGTLDEIKPSLEREAYESKAPALLISEDSKKFSLIYMTNLDSCKKDRSFTSVMSKIDGSPFSREYCNP